MYLLHTEGNNGRVSSVCVHVFYVQRYAGDNAARCQGAKLNPQERGVRPTRASVMALQRHAETCSAFFPVGNKHTQTHSPDIPTDI